jgi:uncharacterized membrane protein
VLALIAAAGVLVRRFFVLSHKHRYVVGLPVGAALLLAVAAIMIVPRAPSGAGPNVGYAQVAPIVAQRCAVCHSAQPTEPGFSAPPEGVLLDTPAHLEANAQRVYDQAVATHTMPLGNVTHMTDAERATLGAWISAGARI